MELLQQLARDNGVQVEERPMEDDGALADVKRAQQRAQLQERTLKDAVASREDTRENLTRTQEEGQRYWKTCEVCNYVEEDEVGQVASSSRCYSGGSKASTRRKREYGGVKARFSPKFAIPKRGKRSDKKIIIKKTLEAGPKLRERS